MRKLVVPALLAALAAVQLIRIERVAAGDPATPIDPASEEVTRFPADGSVAFSAAADDEARLKEFQEIAEQPYVIEPPDVLTVTLTPQPGRSLGISVNSDAATTARSISIQCPVAVDGRVYLGANDGPSTIYVAGMTLVQAREAIHKSVKGEASPFENVERVDVRVSQYNSKVAYVIDQRGKFGEVVRMAVPFPLTVDFNVGTALAQTEAREFDLADARIKIARPAPNGVGGELVLPVAWDPATGEPTPDTNHPLLPGDRVFVEAPASAQPRTIKPHDELAVTFQRADGARLDLVDAVGLRGTPRVSVSPSADSITFLVPVDDDGRVDFQVWFKSGAIEVAGKTLDEAAQAIHDGVLGSQDRDYAVDVAPAATSPAPPPKPAVRRPFTLPSRAYSTEAPAPKGLPRVPPPIPGTVATDPGPDAAVTLVLKRPGVRVHEQLIPLTGPTTLCGLLADAAYPEPIDFAAAMITLTRPFGPPELGGETEIFVGWDQATQRPTADSDYGLEDGDTVTINLVGPPKGAKIYAAPPLPRKAKPAAKPQAAADPARQLEFQFQFVDDATGALADFELPVNGGGISVGDSRAVLSALRVFKKHKLIATLSRPVIRTEVGRPASVNLMEPVEGKGDGGADFRVVRAVTVLARKQIDGGGKNGLLVEVRARAGRSEIDMGMAMQVGQTAIVQIPPADGADDLPAHYIVVTPRWVE